jgi:signal transduction histidine kinase
VVLVDASVDDDRVPLRDELVLPNHRNRLALRFAAPSYRDPSRLRYQVRVSPDDPWTAVSGPPVFRWVNLRPGRYQAEVRASLDGRTWTAEPARFAFRVRPPWYLAPWAVTLFGLVAAGAVVVVYRARVAFLLGLERQRTRIAMDLHDELGSGLGSIGILSGVLAGQPLDPLGRRKLVRQIAEISQDLGTALSDIVWSLDPRSSTLEDVAGRLAEHGGRLFSGDSAQFAVRFPEAWPATPLDFPIRRGVLLIGLEALHNAARHARARHVTLAVDRSDGAWQLVVEDDGCGLSAAARRGDGGGVGLRSLRRRAAEVGGRIAWSDRPGGGTRVTLAFPVSGRPARRRRGILPG